jgi:hypothetical protein
MLIRLRRLKNTALAMVCAALAGCAALECDTNWYETGRRDGLIGAETQVEYYSGRCDGNVDVLRYLEGWHAGTAMRPRISAM